MKIWCDVCCKKKASLFCSADEAALCDECDTRVHHANKLASKHQRLSLLNPSSSHPPLCDICKVKKAMLFCKQDRAILCTDCDAPIHTANELTQKHDRFLLSGFNLSMSVSNTFKATECVNSQLMSNTDDGSTSTSSISQYLTEMEPAWKVEDLLDSSLDFDGFSKGSSENDMLFVDTNLESRATSFESMGLWVPQVPTYNTGFSGVMGFEEGDMGRQAPRKSLNPGFIVPDMTHQSTSSKQSRGF